MFGLNSVSHWLILLAVVLLVFGTGKLRHVGRDLGNAIAGFRKGMKDGSAIEADKRPSDPPGSGDRQRP